MFPAQGDLKSLGGEQILSNEEGGNRFQVRMISLGCVAIHLYIV